VNTCPKCGQEASGMPFHTCAGKALTTTDRLSLIEAKCRLLIAIELACDPLLQDAAKIAGWKSTLAAIKKFRAMETSGAEELSDRDSREGISEILAAWPITLIQ